MRTAFVALVAAAVLLVGAQAAAIAPPSYCGDFSTGPRGYEFYANGQFGPQAFSGDRTGYFACTATGYVAGNCSG